MSYYHLTIEDRKSIERYYRQGYGVSKIAQETGFHKSTISRELRRNPSRDYGYNALGAQRKAKQRRKNSVNTPVLAQECEARNEVIKGLGLFFSPEEIAGSMPKEHRVCTTTIYRALKKKVLPKGLEKNLRQHSKKYAAKSNKPKNTGNSKIKNISTRDEVIETRTTFGHWELDTVVYREECGFHLATFVERKSRYIIIVKLPNKKVATMNKAIIQTFEQIPAEYRLTLTVDNGMEFSDWQTIEAALPGTTVYYCNPYSPWQRGTNENTNGLIRQFLPRKKILLGVTDEDIQCIQYLLNIRPRKCLNWCSPKQLFCCT